MLWKFIPVWCNPFGYSLINGKIYTYYFMLIPVYIREFSPIYNIITF